MRAVGLHLRVTETLPAVAQKALALELPLFQCFLLHQQTNRLLVPSKQEIEQFIALREHFGSLFVHASYWTNFASIEDISLRIFKKELDLAKRLQFNHILIHPGCAKGAKDRVEGIDAVVRRLNYILKKEQGIKLVLENTAHGNFSIGGDMSDMKAILEKSDYPEKLSFCIDTAHAHVYGYPLGQEQDRQTFFDHIEHTIGFERIALIHLNNSNQAVGSRMDRHVLLHDGILSMDALQGFIFHPKLQQVPIIMELPIVEEQAERDAISMVRGWHNK